MGNDGLIELFYTLIERIVAHGKRNGLEIGQRMGEDATDIRALKYDTEAHYSGYYKEYGINLTWYLILTMMHYHWLLPPLI